MKLFPKGWVDLVWLPCLQKFKKAHMLFPATKMERGQLRKWRDILKVLRMHQQGIGRYNLIVAEHQRQKTSKSESLYS